MGRYQHELSTYICVVGICGIAQCCCGEATGKACRAHAHRLGRVRAMPGDMTTWPGECGAVPVRALTVLYGTSSYLHR